MARTRRVIIVAAPALALLIASPSPGTAGLMYYRVNTNPGHGLNVRSGPGEQFQVVETLPRGTMVPIVCTAHDASGRLWDKISERDTWVLDRYVYTRTSRPVAGRCGDPSSAVFGGGPDADMRASLQRTWSFDEAAALWATLGDVRQHQQEWRDAYAQTLYRIARRQARRTAGITSEQDWNVSRGLRANEKMVRRVYRYYEELYFTDNRLLWAGAAKLAGGPVYAGMQDTHDLIAQGAETVSHRLLQMQKEIFNDLAWQHELFLARGIEGMQAAQAGRIVLQGGEVQQGLGDAGARNAQLVQGPTSLISAWEDIASGEPQRVQRAVRVMLAREQDPVLQHFYDDLQRDYGFFMRQTSDRIQSPIPNGEGGTGTKFRDIKPHHIVHARSDFPFVTYEVPMSYHGDHTEAINVAYWEDRQRWLFDYMIPEFTSMLLNKQEFMHQEIRKPVGDRAQDYRQLHYFVPL